MEDVRAGQPLAAAPDRLLADDALLLPGRFLWRRLRRRAREDAGVAAPLGDGAHAARLEAGHFVEGVAALPKLVAHNFAHDVGGRGANGGEGHLRQERHDEHRPRPSPVVARRVLVAPFILQRRDDDDDCCEGHDGAERRRDEAWNARPGQPARAPRTPSARPPVATANHSAVIARPLRSSGCGPLRQHRAHEAERAQFCI